MSVSAASRVADAVSRSLEKLTQFTFFSGRYTCFLTDQGGLTWEVMNCKRR